VGVQDLLAPVTRRYGNERAPWETKEQAADLLKKNKTWGEARPNADIPRGYPRVQEIVTGPLLLV